MKAINLPALLLALESGTYVDIVGFKISPVVNV
jgi:hypothetical protein